MSKKKTENIFLIVYIIYIANQVLSESQFVNIEFINRILGVTRYLVLFFLLFLIVYKKTFQSRTKLITLVLLMGFVALNLIAVDGGISLLMIVLFMMASQGYSLRKIFKASILTMIVMHVFVMGCAYVGILEDFVEYRYLGKLSGSFLTDIYNRFSGAYNRHSMGFLVHNQIPLAFFCVYVMFIAYKREYIKWYENIFAMTLNIVIFNCFGSRLIFVIDIAVCVLYYVVKLSNKMVKKRTNIFWLAYPVCTIVSFVTALQYNQYNSLALKLDLIFNNRVRLAKEALDFYGLGLIGAGQYAGTYNSLAFLENTVDNGYIAIFIQTGMVVATIVIAIWTYLTYVSEKNNNRYLMLALAILAVENLLNSHLGSYKLIPFFCILMNTKDSFVQGEWSGRKKVRLKIT